MTFAAFPKLVPELRRYVWLAAIDFYTPRAYEFYPDIKRDYSQPEPPNYIPTFEDAQLLPGREFGDSRYFLENSYDARWPDLIVSTQMIRALLATCHESRAVALHRFPDKLPFGTISWDSLRVEKRPRGLVEHIDWVGRPPSPIPVPTERTRYWLPFSGELDIIVFGIQDNAYERMYANWVACGGKPLVENVRNVALYAGENSRCNYSEERTDPVRVARPWNPPDEPCHCGKSTCDSCREDPLLEFLSTCFPRLKTLSFAILDKDGGGGYRHPQAGWEPKPPALELVSRCVCPRDDGAETKAGSAAVLVGNSSSHRHEWPMVQYMNQHLEWCVWYPEAQTECPFPKIYPLEKTRRVWLPGWPYYESLSHVEVRVLRCVEIEKGKDELVSGWSWRD